MRTRSWTPSGQAWVKRARWAATAAAMASLAREADKEGVALGIDLMAMVALKGATQQGPALAELLGVLRAQVLHEARRAFDIGEEQRDGSPRQVRHLAPPDKGW
jgi:hypothetical protein